MRITLALPLLAAFVLAGCGEETDAEQTDAALSTGEALPEIVDNVALPQPGEYSITYELVSFEVPGATSIDMDRLRSEFADGAGEQASFCVTEAMDRAAWVSAMNDNICSVSRLQDEGDQIDLTMTCQAEDGPQGPVTLTGTQGETGSNLEMRFTQPIPGHGEANVVTRLISERTGDCS